MIEFDIPKEKSSIIKVFGVGGGGSNAVTHMYKLGIEGVNYVICNTDNQALEISEVPNKIQLGSSLRSGLGAGSKAEVGKEATEEAIDQLEEILQTNTKMVFITAGMGGGTGTGGAPVVARLAKDMGILTVAIVTTPFVFEGKKRKIQADKGIEELKKEVDALLVISNDKLRDIHGNLKMSEAFSKADDILTVAAKGIAEIITKIGYINVDFEDVNTVMRDSGVALMGVGHASGENRSISAVEKALNSPLLNDNNISGAKSVLLNVSYGEEELMMDEMGEITDYIQDAIGIESDNVIWGLSEDESLGQEIRITLIATGFESNEERVERVKQSQRVVHKLSAGTPKRNEDDKKFENSSSVRNSSSPYLKGDSERGNGQISFEFDSRNVSSNFSSNSDIESVSVENIDNLKPNAEPISEVFYMSTEIEPSIQLGNDEKTEFVESEPMQVKPETTKEVYDEEMEARISRLKSFGLKYRNEDLEDLENIPAYKRKNIDIENRKPSNSNENVSKYSLNENPKDGDYPFKRNSYLHDNVD